MNLPIPESDSIFFATDYTNLNQEFIDWFCDFALPDYDTCERDLYLEKKSAVSLTLSKYNFILLRTGIQTNNWIKYLLFLIDDPEIIQMMQELDAQNITDELDWKSFYSSDEFSPYMSQLFKRNYLFSLFLKPELPYEIIEWFAGLPLEFRIRHYCKTSEIQPQYCRYEGIQEDSEHWKVLFLLKLVDRHLFELINSKEVTSLITKFDESPDIQLTLITIMQSLDPYKAQQICKSLRHMQLIEMAQLPHFEKKMELTLYNLVHESKTQIFLGDHLAAQFVKELLSLCCQKSDVMDLINSTIIEQLSQIPINDLASIIFQENAFEYLLLEKNKDVYEEYFELFMNRFCEEKSLSFFESWLRELVIEPINLHTLATQILQEFSDYSEDLYSLYVLSETSTQFNMEEGTDGILSEDMMNWAIESPSNMRRLLTLDCENWENGDSHFIWMQEVIKRWIGFTLNLKDLHPVKFKEEFTIAYAQSDDFDSYLSIFDESLPLLSQKYSNDVCEFQPPEGEILILQILIACTSMTDRPYLAFTISSDPLLMLFKLIQENPEQPISWIRKEYLAVCRTLPLSKKKNFQNSISRIKFLHECKFYKY